MSVWRILKEPDSFLARVFKAKYFSGTDIWRASPAIPKSAFWSSVLNVLPQVENSCHLQIASGNSSIWSSPWCEDWKEIYHHLLSQPGTVCPSKVSDLWHHNSKSWDVEKISLHFDDHIKDKIMQVPIINAELDDMLCWEHTPTGLCTTKSAYKTFLQDQEAPTANPRQSLTMDELRILMQAWKNSDLPPRVKTFAWRLIRRALASGLRASRFSTHIRKECSRCGLLETDIHLFFHCSFARAVWFSLLGFKINNFDQSFYPSNIIRFLLASWHPIASIEIVFATLWMIWKARNDMLFNKISWSISKVISAAYALISAGKEENLALSVIDAQQPTVIPCNVSPDISFSLPAGPTAFCDADSTRQLTLMLLDWAFTYMIQPGT